jgi:predicted alpha/beta-fold hydrolase
VDGWRAQRYRAVCVDRRQVSGSPAAAPLGLGRDIRSVAQGLTDSSTLRGASTGCSLGFFACAFFLSRRFCDKLLALAGAGAAPLDCGTAIASA